ncbi:MAG: FadR/GntR family transcriptional regulator [Armatimonadota bacterium]|nr:FadR/GntR family transcriptional regulator [Armatimonadota bacterium]
MGIQVRKLEPVKRTSLTSQVMEAVKSYIIDNNLQPGDRLPTEKELTTTLGVSRNILREALKSLEAVGLIEIKVGDGMYVSDFDYSSVVTHISFALARNGKELDHFLEARLVIEVGALDFVVERLTEDELAKLEEINTRVSGAESVEERAEADLEFHKSLLAIAGNPVLNEFGAFLARFFAETLALTDRHSTQVTASAHKALIEALRSRDAGAAKEIMRKHILTWKEG